MTATVTSFRRTFSWKFMCDAVMRSPRSRSAVAGGLVSEMSPAPRDGVLEAALQVDPGSKSQKALGLVHRRDAAPSVLEPFPVVGFVGHKFHREPGPRETLDGPGQV